ncbi:sensor domain-containing phosphodiesterase [Larsenimonas suaedae]|uniref:EAL domain-containing protein n=1 Tax=Larsenimonas suaedae TaxID=1851019 RepID=A0ABU1GRY3_9GAMM|nr:EAL domain-containing protein [Larsenimonas suaedae]MCM2972428.1 EAL domain-containing protein [Larsenimonas suaedae]MDR5894776.1 EAL domain-containing protein [Larsenimonas suaedae]
MFAPPDGEQRRLKVLAEYNLLNTAPEDNFDRLVALTSRMFNVPVVLISLIGRDEQFFKAKVGLDVCQTERSSSFCVHAIEQDDVMVVPDALDDPRFSTNRLVLGPPYIRFYAGKPLCAPGGEKLGTICLIDQTPHHEFSAADERNLTDIAALIMSRLEVRRLEHLKRINEARFNNVAASSPDAILFFDARGIIQYWNGAAERIFGYNADEVVGRPGHILVPDSWRARYEQRIAALEGGDAWRLPKKPIELPGLKKNGREFAAEFSLSVWHEGDTLSIGAIVRDITERKLNEQRLYHLASTDPLTNLYNRGYWRQALDEQLERACRATVLMMDLDGFKAINDTFGHSAGDDVLKGVALRLRALCDDTMDIARFGGDEFVISMPGNDVTKAVQLGNAIISELSEPYALSGGRRGDIGVSVGIARAPKHGSNSGQLLGAADLALYRAKENGKGGCVVFEPAFQDVAQARKAFEKELNHAFKNGEFEIYYQPQFATRDGRLTGAEALIRWNHPERGLLSPDEFIGVLGKKPSANAVGEWIIRTACEQIARWRKTFPALRIGVNLFDSQLRTPRLLTVVTRILAEFDLPPSALELELVESTLLRSDSLTLKLLNDLRAAGIGLAFDDYGTGYASLSMLKEYPVTRLKIDRTFVKDMTESQADAAVIKAVLYLGRNFGLDVIAEGVETPAQMAFLEQNGCLEAQGYLYGAPMQAEAFEQLFLRDKTVSMP